MAAKKKTPLGKLDPREFNREDLPSLRSNGYLSIHVSDLHFRHNAPRCRTGEPDWYEAMGRVTEELTAVRDFLSPAPIFYAGDIFHRWDACPQVINWAIDNLPSGYAVPGNHDLPNHNYANKKDSAYWTLVKFGVLTDLLPERITRINKQLNAVGFPYGFGLRNDFDFDSSASKFNIAIIHKFVESPYGLPAHYRAPKQTAADFCGDLEGFDAAAFGDNHDFFTTLIKGSMRLPMINTGCVMRQSLTEIAYKPSIGLLHVDGRFDVYRLDTSKDIIERKGLVSMAHSEWRTEFAEELERIEEVSIDFVRVLRNAMEKESFSYPVRKILERALDVNNI